MIPPQHVIEHAIQIARLSPCRSKRGVVLWEPISGSFRGHGFNAPPSLLPCPGRDVCSGTCGQRAVHAEVRAVVDSLDYRSRGNGIDHLEGATYDLLHVELAPAELVRIAVDRDREGVPIGHAPYRLTGHVLACDGPSCGSCAALIADVAFIAGVWLFEASERGWAQWRRYSADEFYETTMQRVSVPRAELPISVGGRHIHE
jgi:hypothetical protein